MKRRSLALALCAGSLAWGCSDEPTPPPVIEPPDEVVRPGAVQTVDLLATNYTMPAEWDAGATFHVAVHTDGRIVAGGASGLYLLGEDTTLLDPTPVRGIIADAVLGFVVATDDGVCVYDTEIFESAINDMLGDTQVRELVRRRAETWLVTDTMLFELEDGALSSYPDLSAVATLITHDDSDHLVVHHEDGNITLLRDDDSGLAAQDLSEELGDMILAAPGPQGRVLAVSGADGALFERVAVEGGVAWWPVALSTDAEDAGALGIERAVPDPVGGSLWLTSGATLLRIDGGAVVSEVAWPSGIGAGASLAATSDGAIWMTEADQLVRVGPQSPPPSFEEHVVPWYDDNCGKCHDPGGEVATATRFGDYEGFSAQIDIIIQQIDDGLMPAGDNELVGDPDLPRQWRDGGMRP